MNKIGKFSYRVLAILISFCLVFEQTGFAQLLPQTGIPAYLNNGPISSDKFRPVQLRSLAYDSLNNNFALFLDKGDSQDMAPAQIQENTRKLMEYFRVGIALPNSKFWVNLRPDSANEIIDPGLAKTDLGKVLLEADLQLKKDMAGFTSPNTPEGRQYWTKVYEKAAELFGSAEMNIPTLTRPWIVPGEVVIRKDRASAYIYKASLKVMLEQDYLKDSPQYNFADPRLKELNGYSSQLIRELIIPKLTREVNSAKRYSDLRQVYYSLVLAQWFKQSFQGQTNTFSASIDGNDLTGLTSKIPWDKDVYFKSYQRSFANGEYDQKENVSGIFGMKIRRYFSGGIIPVVDAKTIKVELEGSAAVAQAGLLRIELPGGDLNAAGNIALALNRQDLNLNKADGGNKEIKKWLGKKVVFDNLNGDMFRDYDYRSQINKDVDAKKNPELQKKITPEEAFRFGVVWAKMSLEKAVKSGIDLSKPENRVALVARDARKIEDDLPSAVIDAFKYMGLDVKYTGEKPNAVTSYSWAVQQFRPLISVFITASHVVAAENIQVRGFKVAMVDAKGGTVQSMTTQEIKEGSRVEIERFLKDPAKFMGEVEALRNKLGLTAGKMDAVDVDENCIRMNTLIGRIAANEGSLYDLAQSFADKNKEVANVLEEQEKLAVKTRPLSGIKLVIEGANTPSGELARRTFENLGAEVKLLNPDVVLVTGEHKADPAKSENLDGLRLAMQSEETFPDGRKADFGMAFDLDGDRGAIVVPVKDGFETLTPDNLIVALLENLIGKWGYQQSGKKIAVIRDVLGTYAVNDKTQKLAVGKAEDSVTTEQTDAGYVFLKAQRRELVKNGYVVPIYGERSGHCWLDVTGEIENPIAVAVLFSSLAAKFKEVNPEATFLFKDVYEANILPYYQAPRFSAKFSEKFLQRLKNDENLNRDRSGNKIWPEVYKKGDKIPQEFIALARNAVIEKLRNDFSEGRIFNTPAGDLKVGKLLTVQDPGDQRFRFADIHFDLPDGRFAGRFVFRASSNDPLYVLTYESPVLDGEKNRDAARERAMAIGGLVMDWLERNDFATLTKEAMMLEENSALGVINDDDIDPDQLKKIEAIQKGIESNVKKWDITEPLGHLDKFRSWQQVKIGPFARDWQSMRAIAQGGFASETNIYQAVFDNAQAKAFGEYFKGYKWPGKSGFNSETTIVPDLKATPAAQAQGKKVIGNGLGVLSVIRQYSQNLADGLKLEKSKSYNLRELLASEEARSFLHNIIITSGGQAQRNAKYSQIGKCLAKIPMADKERQEARYILDALLDVAINLESNYKPEEFMFGIIYGDAVISFNPEKLAEALANPVTRKDLACLLLKMDYKTAPDYGFAKLAESNGQIDKFQEKYNKIKRDDKGEINAKVEEVEAIRDMGTDAQRALLIQLFETKNIDLLEKIFPDQESRNDLMYLWLKKGGYLTLDDKIYMNPAFSVMGIEAFLKSAFLAGTIDQEGNIQVGPDGKVVFQTESYLSQALDGNKGDKVNIDYYGNIVPAFASKAADNDISKAVNGKGTLYAVPFEGTWYDTGAIVGERDINTQEDKTREVVTTYALQPEVNSKLKIAGKKVANFGTDSWVEAENGVADPKSVQSDSYVKTGFLKLEKGAQLYNVLFKNLPSLEIGNDYVLTLSTLLRNGKEYLVPVIWDQKDDLKKGYFGGRTKSNDPDSAVLIALWAQEKGLAVEKIIDGYAGKETKINAMPEEDRRLAWRDSVDLYSTKLFPVISLESFNAWNNKQKISDPQEEELLNELPEILKFLQHKIASAPSSYKKAVADGRVASRGDTYNNQAPGALFQMRQEISNLVKESFDGVTTKPNNYKKAEDNAGSRDGGTQKLESDLKGGVDFRAIPVGAGMISPIPLTPRVAEMVNNASIQDLDREWQEIQQKMTWGQMPYNELKDYVAVCCRRADTAKQIEELQAWVNNVLILEEAAAVPTSEELKEVLITLG